MQLNYNRLDCQYRLKIPYQYANFIEKDDNAVEVVSDIIECPIEVIHRVYSMDISRLERAIYFKKLYESVGSYTLGDMYKKYYMNNYGRMTNYTEDEKKFIYRCNYSDIPIREVYKIEFLKNMNK